RDARWSAFDDCRHHRRRSAAGPRRSNSVERNSRMAAHRARVGRTEKAALVGLIAGRARRLDAERSLDELAGLAEAAGAEVVLRVLQERPKPDPATLLGPGKVATPAAPSPHTDLDRVTPTHQLQPAQ